MIVFITWTTTSKVVFCGLFHSTSWCHTDMIMPLFIHSRAKNLALTMLPVVHIRHVLKLLVRCGSSSHEFWASIAIPLSRHVMESGVKWWDSLVKVSHLSHLWAFHCHVLLVGGSLSHETSHSRIGSSSWVVFSLPTLLHVEWCFQIRVFRYVIRLRNPRFKITICVLNHSLELPLLWKINVTPSLLAHKPCPLVFENLNGYLKNENQ